MRKIVAASLLSLGLSSFGVAASQAANPGDTAKFKLDQLTFTGNSRVSTETLQSVVGLNEGDMVNRDSIVQAFNNVVAEYGKENVGGSVKPVMTYPRNGHIDIDFQITESAPATVTTVQPVLDHETFTGNVKVSSALLQPALTIKPGSPVTKEEIEADLQSLSKIYKGANQSVLINTQISQNAGHVDINFVIDENPKKKSAS